MTDSPAGDDAALAGRSIAVPETRQRDVLTGLLERRGARVLRCPLVGIHDAADQRPIVLMNVPAWSSTHTATTFLGA